MRFNLVNYQDYFIVFVIISCLVGFGIYKYYPNSIPTSYTELISTNLSVENEIHKIGILPDMSFDITLKDGKRIKKALSLEIIPEAKPFLIELFNSSSNLTFKFDPFNIYLDTAEGKKDLIGILQEKNLIWSE